RMPPSGPWRWEGPRFEQSISIYDHVAITTTHKRDNIFSLGARSQPDHAELKNRKDGRHLDRIRSEGWFRPWVQSHSAIHVTRLAAELIGPTEQLVGKRLLR
ncbi:MAG: hypothetical protein WBX95_17630, partial [Xanthobacteraceae bacterium]